MGDGGDLQMPSRCQLLGMISNFVNTINRGWFDSHSHSSSYICSYLQ